MCNKSHFFFSTIFVDKINYYILGDYMKVKIFDEENEKDLEKDINDFIEELDKEVIDIKYQVSCSIYSEELIFCFSAMIVYLIKYIYNFKIKLICDMII